MEIKTRGGASDMKSDHCNGSRLGVEGIESGRKLIEEKLKCQRTRSLSEIQNSRSNEPEGKQMG